MRPIILLLFFIALGGNVAAQKIRFTDPTNVWKMLVIVHRGGGSLSYDDGKEAEARFQADTIIGTEQYRLLKFDDYYHAGDLAVREDSIQQKIFFRYLNFNDTAEHLFFDYNLQAGDTLKVKSRYFTVLEHLVQSIDSVLIGGYYYKSWLMKGLPTGIIEVDYTFVEGIGPLNNPAFSTHPWINSAEQCQLRCFSNRGSTPGISPSQSLPLASKSVDFGLTPVAFFDNSTSCGFTRVGIEPVKTSDEAMVYPNPGNADITLRLPGNVNRGVLRVSDVTGRSIHLRAFENTKEINIGQFLSTPGVYFYTVQDAATGQRHSGKFIFQ